MRRGGWVWLARYGLAVLCVLAAVLVYYLPVIGGDAGTAGILALLAVIAAARWGGTGPGLLATALLVLITWPGEVRREQVVRHVLHSTGGVAISLMIGSLREARRRAEAETARARAAEREVEHLNADLARRVAELNTILEVIPVGIGIAGDRECRNIRVNPYFSRILGLAPGAEASLTASEEERPTHFRVFHEGREVPPAELPMQQAARLGQGVHDVEMDIVHDDGTVFALLESAAPLIDAEGQVRGSVGAFLDITELKKTRQQLIQARDTAEAASRAKDLFLAMLSHELRTPLAPALLALSALLEDERTPETLREELGVVLQGIALEARLVDDLLDATRVGAGKLRLVMQRVDVHDVVRQAVALCRRDVDAAGVELRLELEETIESHVRADAVRLQQVLWNLLKNACKFTPAGGIVSIRSRFLPGASSDGPGRVVIEVHDTGVGMEPGLIDRIFDPFEQGGEGLHRPGGLGLGLAIARTIAEAHGGQLRASSGGPGQGSVFTLELPTAPAASPPASPTGPPDGARPLPRRLLLVEDDPATSTVLARLLRRRGAEVTAARGLREARAAAENAEFDLIISDLGLPDGSGLELARWLALRGGRTPSIALSGYGSEEDIRRSLEAGFAAHLTKPVDIRTLEAAILTATAG
jgi:PAS domain S-box-containing protein